MSVKQIAYKDKKVVCYGDVTVTFGETCGRDFAIAFEQTIAKMDDAIDLIYEPLHSKGVAKKHPDDPYDEKVGRIVSSKKAELNANKQIVNALYKELDYLYDLTTMCVNKINELKARQEYLKAKE